MLNPGDLGTTVRSKVRGISVMGSYEVEGDTVLLTSADFGDASAPLNGGAPEQVAERLLHDLAETVMAQSGEPYMRDDEANSPPPHSPERRRLGPSGSPGLSNQ